MPILPVTKWSASFAGLGACAEVGEGKRVGLPGGMTRRTRIVIAAVTVLVAAVLVSSTVGRALYAGRTPGLGSFVVVHFAGYLFFLLMPVEALVPYYQAEGHPGGVLVFLAVLTALAAQTIDYGIGRAVGSGMLEDFLGRKRYAKFSGLIGRWGSWAILTFNLFPLSSPNMLLVAGMSRFGAVRALAWSAAGLIAKYIAIVYLFDALGRGPG